MKSIKPGRGPSAMGAMGSVIAVIFGVIWTIMASKMGAPMFFPIFGVLFIVMGIVQAVFHFKNATSKNRFSSFDITEDGEEVDPLEQRFTDIKTSSVNTDTLKSKKNAGFCPYCGECVSVDCEFCPKCGKELP